MKTWKFILAATIIASCLAAAATEPAARRADHVILISIDGFRPDFYRDATWPAPTLQRMAAEGVSVAEVQGVFPSVTYPSHTSIITGAKPARHGIFYNEPFEPEGHTGAWYWHEKDIRVDTLWDAVKAAGLTSASFSWPVSVGAPTDFNTPEIWPLDREVDLFETLRAHARPAGLWQELEAKAVGVMTQSTYATESLVRDLRTAMAAAHILETRKPNLVMVHLFQTDFAQHDEGRESARLRRTVAMADTCVALLWEAVERAGLADRTALAITGDHGFVNVHSMLAPNHWLAEAGLRGKSRGADDWRATFHTTGSAAFLRLRDPNDQAALDQVKQLIENLPPARRALFHMLDREALARIGGPADTPLALSPVQGVKIVPWVPDEGDLVAGTRRGDHGYLPDFSEIHTGFIGYGAGFQSELRAKRISLVDIAPMVSHLLDLGMKTPDGALHPGFFTALPEAEDEGE